MAYNNVFPMTYNPMYYPQYNQQQQPQQPQVTQQVQNGGFVAVKNEDEARNYLVAQGTSVTFRDESAPYIYTKTMGFSQLDQPVFEKFRLVKEDEAAPEKTSAIDFIQKSEFEKAKSEFVQKSEFEKIQNEIEQLKQQLKCDDFVKKGKIKVNE